MNDIVTEMYEDFILSEACSRYYAFAMEDNGENNAQDIGQYIKYMDHCDLCKRGAEACVNYLETKDISKLLYNLKLLGLSENVLIIKEYLLFSGLLREKK